MSFNKIDRIIANSDNKQTLKKHLHGTMLMAMHCAKQMGVTDNDIINIIGLVAFLHDIGKVTTYFQEIVLTDDYSKENIVKHYPNHGSDSYPKHNEISWLYATHHAKKLLKKIGLQAIYWHHGTYLKQNVILDEAKPRTTSSVIAELKSFGEDVDAIFNQMDSVTSSFEFPFDLSKYFDNEIDDESRTISRLFVDDINGDDISNAQRMIVRSCLIFADHLVSKLSCEELDDLILNVEKYYPNTNNVKYGDFECPQGYNTDRFNIQKNILEDCDRTTVVKAPAGFGKSLIGLMWGAKQNGQIYWVCPRNSVAQGVFNNLVKEIEQFNLDISIELFLTSERKDERNGKNIRAGGCDIVVTNIDNLLSPMVNQKATSRLFDVTVSNIVFDEYHEFLNDEALFGAFIVYMKARNLVAKNCKTLLLSATPSIYHQFWDGKEKTKILPNNEEHYPAQHQDLYQIFIDDDFVNDSKPGSLTMYSSVRNVQAAFNKGNYTHIAHSLYSDQDEEHNLKEIMNLFGKNGNKNGIVVSAPILQAALDISFTGLYKTIESPESDIQTIGRINRWGEQNNVCDIRFLKLRSNKSERSAITKRYKCSISDLWSQELEIICQPINLDSLYKLYNEFNKKYNKELVSFITEKYETSIGKLQTFFPRQHKGSGKQVIASKTLRNNKGGYFIVVKFKDSEEWCPYVFNIQSIELNDLKETNRDRIESSTIKTVMTNLEAIGFDYTDIKDKFFGKKSKQRLTIEKFESFIRCAESPLPIFTWRYDRVLGLIKS